MNSTDLAKRLRSKPITGVRLPFSGANAMVSARSAVGVRRLVAALDRAGPAARACAAGRAMESGDRYPHSHKGQLHSMSSVRAAGKSSSFPKTMGCGRYDGDFDFDFDPDFDFDFDPDFDPDFDGVIHRNAYT